MRRDCMLGDTDGLPHGPRTEFPPAMIRLIKLAALCEAGTHQRLLPAQRILHAAHGVLGLPDLFFRGAFNLHFSVAKQAPKETSKRAFGLSGRPFDPVLVHGQYPLFFSADLVTASAPADTSLPMPAVVLQAWSERGAARTATKSRTEVSLGEDMSISPNTGIAATNTASSTAWIYRFGNDGTYLH
jgi:hypothetical protein